jgi:hypothetical protein
VWAWEHCLFVREHFPFVGEHCLFVPEHRPFAREQCLFARHPHPFRATPPELSEARDALAAAHIVLREERRVLGPVPCSSVPDSLTKKETTCPQSPSPPFVGHQVPLPIPEHSPMRLALVGSGRSPYDDVSHAVRWQLAWPGELCSSAP